MTLKWSGLYEGSVDAPRYTENVEFRLDRRALTIATFAEEAKTNRPLAYWRSRPPAERVAAVEFLRRQHIGPGARLRRVLRVAERTRG